MRPALVSRMRDWRATSLRSRSLRAGSAASLSLRDFCQRLTLSVKTTESRTVAAETTFTAETVAAKAAFATFTAEAIAAETAFTAFAAEAVVAIKTTFTAVRIKTAAAIGE